MSKRQNDVDVIEHKSAPKYSLTRALQTLYPSTEVDKLVQTVECDF